MSGSVREAPRLRERARDWRVDLDDAFDTETSTIAFGRRAGQPVVLKVIRRPGDEWRAGEVLSAFDGNGVARAYDHSGGAMLIERLRPGTPLVALVSKERDEEATDVLADVISRMSAREPPPACPTVADWAISFELHLERGDDRIPADLVAEAATIYSDLCVSQRRPRLLHGDLHHSNVLFDAERGWLAVDPKGVVGETEFEVGAILRNPIERPDLFASKATVRRRLAQLAARLALASERALAWGFAQAVLSAIWEIEDGRRVDETSPALRLATVLRPMLG